MPLPRPVAPVACRPPLAEGSRVTRRSLIALAAAACALDVARPALAMTTGASPSMAHAANATNAAPRDAALHVLNRLAFGPAPGDLERVRRLGVDAWIDEQLAPERIALPATLVAQLETLTTANQPARALVQRYRGLEQQVRREAQARENAGGASTTSPAMSPPMSPPMSASAPPAEPEAEASTPALRERRDFVARLAIETADARLARAIGSPRQLEEVMVAFWFDHFNVFEGKGLVRVLAGAYERDAIRPHALGRFRDLLGATAKHPAMLFYLDNWLSVSPDWRPRAPDKHAPSGLNENYARELMELHTLGVDGGYTQADVTQLARMFTGWTFVPATPRAARTQDDSLFVFDAAKHDGGTKTWLGHEVAPRGVAEGEWALDVLAAHPSTARHLATKLARRFVADEPSPALVDDVARAFLSSQGDIRATLRALLRHPAFREAASQPAQYKTPYEFVVSAVRASGLPATNPRPLVAALNQLGQPLYGCPTPDGWAHTQAAWLNPDAVTRRINFATGLAAGRVPIAAAADLAPRAPGAASAAEPVAPHPLDAQALLATLGPAITPATRAVIEHGPPALQAAMVLGSPDFMHR